MKIRMLVMDVDGTLTDGKIYIGDNGEVMKAFDVKDGYAIAHLLPNAGIVPVIITGRKSKIVANRAAEIKIEELHQGVQNKLNKLIEVAEKYALHADEIAYMGDDMNDVECIHFCGITACPCNAIGEVKSAVDYICIHSGGNGAVREFIDYLLTYKS